MNIGTLGRLALACAAAFAFATASAADGIETRPLRFAKGASAATVKGTVKGSQTIDYKVGAKAGQTMTVGLKTSNGSNYFNVLPPGSNDVAVFVGSSDGNDWKGTLEADGTYTIRVYLMRNAARRNETANYTLTVGITGAPAKAAAKPADEDAAASDAAMRDGEALESEANMGSGSFVGGCRVRGAGRAARVGIKPRRACARRWRARGCPGASAKRRHHI